jgi:hypothetical protein
LGPNLKTAGTKRIQKVEVWGRKWASGEECIIQKLIQVGPLKPCILRSSIIRDELSLADSCFPPLVLGVHSLPLFAYIHQSWHGVHAVWISVSCFALSLLFIPKYGFRVTRACISCHIQSFYVPSIYFLVPVP